MRSSIVGGVLRGVGLIALLAMAPAADAQAPPSEASEIAHCLCLRQQVDALSAETGMKRQAYDQTHAELSRLDSQLERERAGMDVNNPQAVARFRQLLERRDALFRRSNGPEASDLASTVERYNARVGEYNARCADRPRNPDLIARVQASLACPAP